MQQSYQSKNISVKHWQGPFLLFLSYFCWKYLQTLISVCFSTFTYAYSKTLVLNSISLKLMPLNDLNKANETISEKTGHFLYKYYSIFVMSVNLSVLGNSWNVNKFSWQSAVGEQSSPTFWGKKLLYSLVVYHSIKMLCHLLEQQCLTSQQYLMSLFKI